MATNPWIQHVDIPQSDLNDDLVVEFIQIHGIDTHYIPRTIVDEDTIFGEDEISKFTYQDVLEMYVETLDGFSGEGDIISKFGLEIRDSATLVFSRTRFLEVITPHDETITKPREGDLIFFPHNKGLFEIKWVEHEQPFYQFGKNYTYKVSVELFSYNHEEIVTGVDDIDNVATDRENDNSIENDPAADNTNIDNEEAEDDVVNWDESSPFGEF